MTHNIKFQKFSGNGNDFIILDNPCSLPEKSILQKLCHRRFGVGADGVIICETSEELLQQSIDARMRIFNSDGSEAEMCGNGLRCLVTYLDSTQDLQKSGKSEYRIKTMNGVYRAVRHMNTFSVEMSEIKDKDKFDLSIFDEYQMAFYVNTGVPHLVFLSEEIDRLDLNSLSPRFRYHPLFPSGVNVNFVEIIHEESDIKERKNAYVRTYERGVEDETFSCGTGLTACALALQKWFGWEGEIVLKTMGGDHLIDLKKDIIFYSGEVDHICNGEFFIENYNPLSSETWNI